MLAAWLAFVVAACVLPCLIGYQFISGTTQTSWSIAGGSIGRVALPITPQPGSNRHRVLWYPDATGLVVFDFQWTINGDPVPHPPFVVIFPVWVVLLIPTLVIGTPILIRNHNRRRETRAGRTLCPSCGYDVTGLTRCPECGAAINPATEPSP